jgi:flavin reductase (DIM6/NTAB) family NADH-FMN oxidoreductase RutF
MNGSAMVPPNEFRSFAGQFVTGVTVVTTRDGEGRFQGLTMNAVSALSLTPPLYLICVERNATTLAPLLESRVFGLSILNKNQSFIARLFATKSQNKFRECPFVVGRTGVPLIDGALGHIECSVVQTVEAGDHIVVIGQVEHADIKGGEPLVYFRSAFLDLGGKPLGDARALAKSP